MAWPLKANLVVSWPTLYAYRCAVFSMTPDAAPPMFRGFGCYGATRRSLRVGNAGH